MRSPLVLLAPLALVAAGCGASSQTASAPRTTAPSAPRAADAPASPVSVLAAGVTVRRGAVTVDLRLRQPADADPPTARSAELTLPPGIAWHGGAAPSCTVAVVRRGGAAACPRGAILGSGASVGLVDTSISKGRITVVNGERGEVLLATVVRHPAYVKSVVVGRIAGAGGGALRVAFRFPPELQTIAGVPVGLQRLTLTIARGRVLQTPSCGNVARRRYGASVVFADGTRAQRAGMAVCRDG